MEHFIYFRGLIHLSWRDVGFLHNLTKVGKNFLGALRTRRQTRFFKIFVSNPKTNLVRVYIGYKYLVDSNWDF